MVTGCVGVDQDGRSRADRGNLLEPTAVLRETHTRQRGLPVLIDISESMSMKDQRKRTEDLVEAAAALDLLPRSDATKPDLAALNLDVKQRQAIASASRLDAWPPIFCLVGSTDLAVDR